MKSRKFQALEPRAWERALARSKNAQKTRKRQKFDFERRVFASFFTQGLEMLYPFFLRWERIQVTTISSHNFAQYKKWLTEEMNKLIKKVKAKNRQLTDAQAIEILKRLVTKAQVRRKKILENLDKERAKRYNSKEQTGAREMGNIHHGAIDHYYTLYFFLNKLELTLSQRKSNR
ncbi:MAG: hypothetical protein HYW50_04095 [Candidatus Diapherotrites archaeon]|nr:hypothetical protein [Candidatus Diapherotrites archaeon]